MWRYGHHHAVPNIEERCLRPWLQRKKNLAFKSSLRHWKHFPYLFIVRILIANSCTRCTESLQGSHRMGGRQNQIFAPLPFIRTFRKIPLLAKSILPDRNLNFMSPPLHYIGSLLFLSLCIILLIRGKRIGDGHLKIGLAKVY